MLTVLFHLSRKTLHLNVKIIRILIIGLPNYNVGCPLARVAMSNQLKSELRTALASARYFVVLLPSALR